MEYGAGMNFLEVNGLFFDDEVIVVNDSFVHGDQIGSEFDESVQSKLFSYFLPSFYTNLLGRLNNK